MLTANEFENWCSCQNLSELSRKTLANIRSTEPARRVGGGRKNVSGFYPSKKMGKTIQFELCNTLCTQRLRDTASIVVNALYNDIQACKQY